MDEKQGEIKTGRNKNREEGCEIMGKRGLYAGRLVLFLTGIFLSGILLSGILLSDILPSGIVRARASADYANAKEFYESTNGQNSHIKVLDGDIYFATRGKEASSGGGLRYTAAGFDICIKGSGRQVNLAVKRGGVLMEVPGAAVQDGGYWYNLYRITLSDICRLAAGRQGFAEVLESSSVEITMDAIFVIRQGNRNLGSIEEDGFGNVTEQGMVFHLKEEGHWQTVKRMFPGHSFESYRGIRLNVDWKPYIHTVWYQAGEGNTVEKETARVVRGEAVDLTVKAGREGWTHIGWSAEPSAGDVLSSCVMGEQDIRLYAVYQRSITISYDIGDTGGFGTLIPGETKEQFQNASGMYWNPEFILEQGPERENYAFVGWRDEDGDGFRAKETVSLERDTVFTAVWDQYPSIAAKDRYFTLRQAAQGEITEQALLERVTATDREDGILTNGERVRVVGYRAEGYTGLTTEAELSVTYEAVDSAGSRVTEQVTVYIVDTTPREVTETTHVRFISGKFYRNGEDYVSPRDGGLMENSIWKVSEAYRTVLDRALAKQAMREQSVQEEGGQTVDAEEQTDGTETWTFTGEQVQEVKQFVRDNGFGRYRNADGLKVFYRQFGSCR